MYKWTQKYVGLPFVSGGRTIQGCDCYGFVRLVLANEYNIILPELVAGYNNALNSAETKNLFEKNAPLILADKILQPEEKALCLIRTKHGLLTHVGIYAGDGFIMHSRNKTGAVCERLDSPLLAGRLEGWYRVNTSYNPVESIQQ